VDLKAFRTTQQEWKIGLINGANMPNLVNRSPDVYGPPKEMAHIEQQITLLGEAMGVRISTVCSNYDGVILEWLHEHAFNGALDAIVINPGSTLTYGEHIRHCLEDSGLPYVESHFSNLAARYDVTCAYTPTSVGVCQGMRKHSYAAALIATVGMLDDGDFHRPVNYRGS